MSTHDLHQLERWLDALPAVATRTKQRLADLHTLAYDRHVGEHSGSRTTRTDWALDETGSGRAKELWHRCARKAHAALVDLEAIANAIGHYLNDGDPADPTMRGTLLGDEERSASEELAALVRRQGVRQQRGDYTPNREMAQPKVPRR